MMLSYMAMPRCYNSPNIFPHSPDATPTTLLFRKPPVLKDQPPVIFPSATPLDVMGKQPLPMNLSLVEDLPPQPDIPRPMSTQPSLEPLVPAPLPEPLILEPPVKPLVPIPWNTHRQQYLSMEDFVEHMMNNPVSMPMEDPDSPMEDAPPLEPDPDTYYLPDHPEATTHTLSPEESPVEPWQRWLDRPDSPVSRKHSLSPSSPSSAPIRQCTSREGSYHSIMPPVSSPIASTSPQSQSNQSGPSLESSDSTSSMQSPADNDNKLLLNWATIATAYWKG